MATITLRKSRFDNIQNVLDKLGESFKNYESSLNELRHTVEGVDSNTCNLTDTIDKIASSSEKEKDKVEKIQKLNKKIENFVNTAIQRERRAKDEIVKKKNDFYKKYRNLKPDCEKGVLEKVAEKYIEVTNAINNWIIEHLDIIIAAIIVLAAIVVCILCPAVIATLGIIVGALSAVMGIADLVCMATHGGKGIADVLAENGHGILAKIWSGTSMGLDIASIILPVGAGINAMKGTAKATIKGTLKNAAKNFVKHPLQTLKNGAKSLGSKALNGVKSIGVKLKNFTLACKDDIFKVAVSGMKSLGTKTLKGIKNILGIDDIQKCYHLLKNGFENGFTNQFGRMAYAYATEGFIDGFADDIATPKNIKNIQNITNGNLTDDIRDKLIQEAIDNGNLDNIALYADNIDTDKVFKKLLEQDKEGKLIAKRNGEIRTYSEINKKVRYDMQSEFKDKLLEKINSDEKFAKNFMEKTGVDTTLRGKRDTTKMTKTQLTKELSRNKLTLHEDFDRDLIQIIPTDLHKALNHTGGTARNMDYLFSAGSRQAKSTYQIDANGVKTKTGSIYGSANYSANKYAKSSLETYYKNDFKRMATLERHIGNLEEKGLSTSVSKSAINKLFK